jgi:hypothetical protein
MQKQARLSVAISAKHTTKKIGPRTEASEILKIRRTNVERIAFNQLQRKKIVYK